LEAKEMLTIEKALELYTDKLNANESIDLDWFKSELPDADYAEFEELIPIIGIAKSTKEKESFDKLFDKINNTKIEFAEEFLPKAAGFRVGDSVGDKEAIDALGNIFNEEFKKK
jgi:hypothetical protein